LWAIAGLSVEEGLLGVKSLQGNISLVGAGFRKTADLQPASPLLTGKSRGVGSDFSHDYGPRPSYHSLRARFHPELRPDSLIDKPARQHLGFDFFPDRSGNFDRRHAYSVLRQAFAGCCFAPHS
jgi:hypothetical protein